RPHRRNDWLYATMISQPLNDRSAAGLLIEIDGKIAQVKLDEYTLGFQPLKRIVECSGESGFAGPRGDRQPVAEIFRRKIGAARENAAPFRISACKRKA